MPAIEMLGRRWSFATDDVPLLGFFPTLFHGLWALVLMIIWIVFGKHRDCYDGTPFTVVLAGLFTTFTMFFAIGCWATYEGLKGGLTTAWCSVHFAGVACSGGVSLAQGLGECQLAG